MDVDEKEKQLVRLNAKDLARYERCPPDLEQPSSTPGPIISNPPNFYKNIKFIECKDSHIGTKILASHVTVQVPKEEINPKWTLARLYMIGAGVATAILIAGAAGLYFSMPDAPHYDPINDGGEHPLDWYYARSERNSSECPEPDIRILRRRIVVDSLEGTCEDPETFLSFLDTLDEDTDFYICGGRVYEGFGWNCSPRADMRVVFVAPQSLTYNDMYSFNALLNIGLLHREIGPDMAVFPACCVESNAKRPSRAVVLFLQTLVRFSERECLVNSASCKSDD